MSGEIFIYFCVLETTANTHVVMFSNRCYYTCLVSSTFFTREQSYFGGSSIQQHLQTITSKTLFGVCQEFIFAAVALTAHLLFMCTMYLGGVVSALLMCLQH